jgi:hypothetical protein
MDAFGRSALSEDDVAYQVGLDQIENAPKIAATIRITTAKRSPRTAIRGNGRAQGK